jgi:hypothetical protein
MPTLSVPCLMLPHATRNLLNLSWVSPVSQVSSWASCLSQASNLSQSQTSNLFRPCSRHQSPTLSPYHIQDPAKEHDTLNQGLHLLNRIVLIILVRGAADIADGMEIHAFDLKHGAGHAIWIDGGVADATAKGERDEDVSRSSAHDGKHRLVVWQRVLEGRGVEQGELISAHGVVLRCEHHWQKRGPSF